MLGRGSSLQDVSLDEDNINPMASILSNLVADEEILTIERSSTAWHVAWECAGLVVLLVPSATSSAYTHAAAG
jgi:hypothetical protein